MQGGFKRQHKKIEKEVIVEKVEDPAIRHWDTWVVQDKFNLRDWYYLEQEENEDLDFSSLAEFIIDILLDNCVTAYIRKNIITYTLFKFEQDILQTLLISKRYPETLRNKIIITKERDEFDSVEPAQSTIDAYSCGWPLPIYDPHFNETKINQFNENQCHSVPSNQTVTEIIHEYSASTNDSPCDLVCNLAGTSKSNLIPRKQLNKKETIRNIANKKRKITVIAHKSIYDLIRKKLSVKPQQPEIEEQIQKEKLQQNQGPKFVDIKSSVMLMVPKIDSHSQTDIESEKNKGAIVALTPPKSVGIKIPAHKMRLSGKETKTTVPVNMIFDHLEPSNFPQNRIKTGYIIKDLEVPKDLVKTPFVKRAPTLPKRGSEVTAKSTIVADETSGNILSMPSVVDKMTNLGGGVIARKDPKPKASASFTVEREDQRPTLKPISRSRVEPRLLISQLIDRNLPSTSTTKTSRS